MSTLSEQGSTGEEAVCDLCGSRFHDMSTYLLHPCHHEPAAGQGTPWVAIYADAEAGTYRTLGKSSQPVVATTRTSVNRRAVGNNPLVVIQGEGQYRDLFWPKPRLVVVSGG